MTTRIGFTFAILFACALVARGDERADFLAAYPAAAAKLQAAYSHCKIVYTVERGDGKISDVEVLADGRQPGTKAISTGFEVLRGPWTGTGAGSISEWLRWPKLKIESVQRTNQGIELRASSPDEGYGAYTWRVIFAPDTLAVLAFDSVVSDGIQHFHHLSYDNGNPPKITRVKQWDESAGKVFGQTDFQIKSLVFGSPASLSASTIGLIIAAVAAAALGVWFLYAAERRKAKP